jgi:hypothetical protein
MPTAFRTLDHRTPITGKRLGARKMAAMRLGFSGSGRLYCGQAPPSAQFSAKPTAMPMVIALYGADIA